VNLTFQLKKVETVKIKPPPSYMIFIEDVAIITQNRKAENKKF
jgi:hypothetical protein